MSFKNNYSSRLFCIIITLTMLLALGCSKDKATAELPKISDIPTIKLLSVAPTTVQQFTDSLVFNIEYEDGNGDIGWNVADSMSLFITDNRIALTERFNLGNVAPMGSNIAVRGIFNVVMHHTILLDPNQSSEQVQFLLQLKDRAGNRSNEVMSTIITVNQ